MENPLFVTVANLVMGHFETLVILLTALSTVTALERLYL